MRRNQETLIKRFSETRRKHPLSDDDHSLDEAIRQEQEVLEPLASTADLRIDTTHTNLHELRDLIRGRVTGGSRQVSLLFESFGFKHGVPRDVDFVFDVRCLPNPHWQTELRPLTGLDGPVANFLESSEESSQMQGGSDPLPRILDPPLRGRWPQLPDHRHRLPPAVNTARSTSPISSTATSNNRGATC